MAYSIDTVQPETFPMGLGILGLLVLLCVFLTQILLYPLNAISTFHLPLPLWFGSLQTWLGLGLLALLVAWLLGDR